MRQWKAEAAIDAEVQAADRMSMVRPSPPGYKPKHKGKAVELRLLLRDATIKAGDSIWYRLELSNVGTEDVRVVDWPSFLKKPSLGSSIHWDFFITRPDGTRKLAPWGTWAALQFGTEAPEQPVKIPDSSKMTEEQIADFIRRDQWRRKADRNMDLTLHPGDSVMSRPWNRHGEPMDPAFARLLTDFKLDKPGTYEVQVVVKDTPSSISEDDIRAAMGRGLSRADALKKEEEKRSFHLGTTESNVVPVVVTGP